MKTNTSPNARRDFLRLSLAAVASGGLATLPLSTGAFAAADPEYDVVIYGGTSAAVTAAIQAKRMGRSVVIVCPDTHLGGLTTSGLGWTDSKDGRAIGGLAREFYERVYKYYTDSSVWNRQTRASYVKQNIGAQPGRAIDEAKQVMWTFEPRGAEAVVNAWLAAEQISVFRNEWLDRGKNGVTKKGTRIESFRTLSGKTFKGRMFIDAGYEGDLMAQAGVKFRVGRDSAKEFNEPLNGIRFPIKGIDRYHGDGAYAGVDPYVVPGQPSSGLIPGVESEYKNADMLRLGDADPQRLQSFNYRLCLTTLPANRTPFVKPEGYDERDFELLFRLAAVGKESGFTTQAMPNRKTDSNNEGSMSGDFIGGSFSVKDKWTYSDASYDRRKEILASHKRYQQGLLWSLQNHPRIPTATREKIGPWGLAADEFVENGNWPYQIYVREARRMVGMSMVTQHHVQLKPGFEVKDSIGLGSYSLDSHTVRRIVVEGTIRNEGSFYVWWDQAYPIPYGSIVPQKGDVSNLLAPVTLSATHAAFGSIRMEPTYMILGQAAATAAVLALENGNRPVQELEYGKLAARLTADKQLLTPPLPKLAPKPA